MKSDVLIFIANIIIAVSLIPSIFSTDKPHIITSLINIFVCALFVCAYKRMGLKLGTIGNSVIGLFWLILLIQKLQP